MPDWIPLCVLPNVSLGSAVDSELMALAPINDPRVVACFEEQPRLSDFLGRFTTAFRAEVNMANAAMLLPEGQVATGHDVGRLIALWISAFEILVHPGENGNSGVVQVYDHLGKVQWLSEAMGQEVHETRSARTAAHRALACWIYGELYRARNDFLHGNPIGEDRLKFRESGRSLVGFAAPLYRMALASFLDLFPKRDVAEDATNEQMVEIAAERARYDFPQMMFEEALELALVSPTDE